MDFDHRVALMHIVDTQMGEENKRIFENIQYEKQDEKRVIFDQMQEIVQKELNSTEYEDSHAQRQMLIETWCDTLNEMVYEQVYALLIDEHV